MNPVNPDNYRNRHHLSLRHLHHHRFLSLFLPRSNRRWDKALCVLAWTAKAASRWQVQDRFRSGHQQQQHLFRHRSRRHRFHRQHIPVHRHQDRYTHPLSNAVSAASLLRRLQCRHIRRHRQQCQARMGHIKPTACRRFPPRQRQQQHTTLTPLAPSKSSTLATRPTRRSQQTSASNSTATTRVVCSSSPHRRGRLRHCPRARNSATR